MTVIILIIILGLCLIGALSFAPRLRLTLTPPRILSTLNSIKSGDSVNEIKFSTPSKSIRSHFVSEFLRPRSMLLHTKDQAPMEGGQPPQTPFSGWKPTRQGYLHFLVDSLAVYEALEEATELPHLVTLRNTGLERVTALKQDIEWLLQYDPNLIRPECGVYGQKYANFLKDTVNDSVPRFICHFYNQYFAHTAGGTMIGKRLSSSLLDGAILKFYQWEVADVKPLLEKVRENIDNIALGWSDDEKNICAEETPVCFDFSGKLFTYLKALPGE